MWNKQQTDQEVQTFIQHGYNRDQLKQESNSNSKKNQVSKPSNKNLTYYTMVRSNKQALPQQTPRPKEMSLDVRGQGAVTQASYLLIGDLALGTSWTGSQ